MSNFVLSLVYKDNFMALRGKGEGEMKNDRQDKKVFIRERIFKAIALKPGDINAVKERLRKQKIADSRTKINDAIDELISSGRLIQDKNNLSVNRALDKNARVVLAANPAYLDIEGDVKHYQLSRRDSEGYRNNDRVMVAFSIFSSGGQTRLQPFIIGKSKPVSKEVFTAPEKDFSDLIYGRVMKLSHDQLVFLPNDKRKFKNPILIMNDNPAPFQDKICTLQLVQAESGTMQAMGIVKDVKGDAGNPIAEYDSIAESHGAIMSWSGSDVLPEIEKIPTQVDLSEVRLVDMDSLPEDGTLDKDEIVDLRQLNFTTTDPATCKDMDDAIFSTVDGNGNIVVYTAVANVSKYVKFNSEIGKKYLKASFTTYAPNKAYNILPPELSTNICSLNPNVDRLALVIKTTVDQHTGKPIKSQIMDAVIASKQKYSYEEAQEICDRNQGLTFENLSQKLQSGESLSADEQVVFNMHASDVLWKGLNQRNLLQFDTDNEYDVLFNEDLSDIVDINAQAHIKYHKVIESFMIVANEATAKYALENNIPIIYRVHDKPNDDRIAQAYEFFGMLGLPFEGDLSPHVLKKLIASVKGSEKEKIVNNFLVRMQCKAKYSDTPYPGEGKHASKKPQSGKNSQNKSGSSHIMSEIVSNMPEKVSHFGLQSAAYAHTTSPIRRSPDLGTHRNIIASLHNQPLLSQNFMRDIALWANQMQDANDSAEREFAEVNSAIYCEHHIGEKMQGHICAFRRLSQSSNAPADDIVVVVENESKGIKVQLPLTELLESRGLTNKRVGISEYGSAIVSGDNNPILTLCQDVSFYIAHADRVTRQVIGSMTPQLEKHDNGQQASTFTEQPQNEEIQTQTRKKERMLKKVNYCREHRYDDEKHEDIQSQLGFKFANQSQYEAFCGLDGSEAYKANRANTHRHHKKRDLNKFEHDLEELVQGQYIFDDDEIEIEK